MTVEEIEILVTAKVEEALKEFQKIIPVIKQSMKQAQDAFSRVDTKAMTNKLHQAVNFMKKKMQDLKKSSENNEIAIKVNNKDAQKQISQIQKQIDSLQEKINARQMKLNVINPQIDKIVDDTRKSVTPEGINPNSKAMDTTVNNALNSNKDFTSLNSQAQKLYTEIEMYNKQLEQAKSKMTQLEQETNKTATAQNKLSSFFGAFKQKIEQVKPSISNIKNSFKGLPKLTQNITNNIKGMGTGVKNGLGHVLKYAGALVSLRSIYSTLSGCAQSWLSSQNAGAKQLSANINYMKNSLGSALAPAITYITNLVYNMMKAIQSVIYALFRVNIFAKASASSYASMAGSAKKAKNETKQLAGVHDEINNVQSNDSTDSGSSGGTSPSFDLSGIDNQMSALGKKLYDFFKPLVDSWNKYGPDLVEQIKTTAGQVTGLISTVWGSFEKIVTNGTVYQSLELILTIIGNIAEAFTNAWQNNGNGDAIVQNLANAFNNLLIAINNVVQSEGFQKWLNSCSDKFRVISEKIAEIDWQPLIDALSNIGESIGTIALDILSGLVDIFKWFVENPIVAEFLLGIAVAIKVIAIAISIYNTAMTIYNAVMPIATAVSTAFGISIGWLIAIIIAIIAVIALIVVAIMNWGTISEWLGQKFEEAKQAITNAFQNIGQWFKDRWNDICNAFSNVGNWFKDKFNNAKEGVQNAWKNVGNWFGDRKKDITNTFSNIGSWFKGKFEDAYNGIKNVFSNIGSFFGNIWNGIKNTFSALGTKIGDAISGAVKSGINGVISLIERTINSAIRLINGGIKLINLIPGVTVGTINTLSLPRLAKGGVLTEATTVLAGEYSGAKTNPEIVTPQNIMRDTFEDVLSNYSGSNNDRPIYLTVNVGNQKLGQILLEDLRDRTRRTGKDIEALVGG